MLHPPEMDARKWDLRREQTPVKADTVIAAQIRDVIGLQNASDRHTDGRHQGGAAPFTIDAPRYLSTTRKPWCERPHRFRRGGHPARAASGGACFWRRAIHRAITQRSVGR